MASINILSSLISILPNQNNSVFIKLKKLTVQFLIDVSIESDLSMSKGLKELIQIWSCRNNDVFRDCILESQFIELLYQRPKSKSSFPRTLVLLYQSQERNVKEEYCITNFQLNCLILKDFMSGKEKGPLQLIDWLKKYSKVLEKNSQYMSEIFKLLDEEKEFINFIIGQNKLPKFLLNKTNSPNERKNERKNGSNEEKKCREIFEKLLGVSFAPCRPKFLANSETGKCMELDGYNPDLSLAFEYQGPFHYSNPEQKKRDIKKKELCSKLKICLIQIPHVVLNKKSYIISILKMKGYLKN